MTNVPLDSHSVIDNTGNLLTVDCPWCHSGVGVPCVNNKGKGLGTWTAVHRYHKSRRLLFEKGKINEKSNQQVLP